MRQLIIEADGGSRGNPGPAGSGALVVDAATGAILVEVARFIGVATNNVAEYTALKSGVEQALAIDPNAALEVRMDSKLVIEQMGGGWKIKHPDMQRLAIEIHGLLQGKPVSWVWVPREENSRADALANRAMDAKADAVVHFETQPDSQIPVQQEPTQQVASVAEFNVQLPSSVRAPIDVTEPLTTIILVRHGRTSLTESKRISGSGGENPPLSAAGWQDAAKAAAAVAQIGKSGAFKHIPAPSAVVASPIQRTRDTASAIAEAISAPVTINSNIAEISFGEWDGLTNEEAMAKDPKHYQRWRGSWTVAPPQGEPLEEFDARVVRGIKEITQEFAGKSVVVVSHVMPIRGFLRAALNAEIETYWRPSVAPCSISIIRFWGLQAAELVTFNATDHLV